MHGTGQPLGELSWRVPDDAVQGAAAAAAALKDAARVLVLGHTGADGDVAGSSLAMATALREMGKQVTVYNELPYPPAFTWLPGGDAVVHTLDPDATFDATVVVDAARTDRLGRDFPSAERRGTYIWIDHHRLADPPGDVNYIDLTAAAVGEQIAAVLAAMGHPLSAGVAKCIYASLITDTGAFRYANTSVRVMNLAGELLKAGVDPWEMTTHVYESVEPAKVRLLGRALGTLSQHAGGKLGVVVLHDADLNAAGAEEGDCHGIVNHVRGVRGVEIAALLRVSPGSTRMVLRSRGTYDAGAVARALGGTGHKNAGKGTFAADDPVATFVAAATPVLTAAP